jgi:membrane-bound inhibitor of C-type lysozyme
VQTGKWPDRTGCAAAGGVDNEMSGSEKSRGATANRLIVRHRKSLWISAGVIVVYALSGFFLAPWLIEKTATDTVREQFGTELSFERVSLNPFALSLELNGLELDQPDSAPFLTVERIFVNFQLSSIFRWAWTFREFHIESPELRISRDGDGEFNFAFLATSPDEVPPPEPAGEGGPARLLIHDFAIRESLVDWYDEVPPEPVATQFGPVNVAISELNTLPARAGLQDVVITTDTQGTLSWNGSLQLNPLHSEGHASVKGSHFPLTSSYLKHEAGFDVRDGEADVEFDYQVTTREDGTLAAEIRNFNLAFSDVIVETFNEAVGRAGEDREVLRLPRMSLSGGELDWPQMRATADSFAIDDAVVELYRDAGGELNVVPPADPNAETTSIEAGDDEDAAGGTWDLSLSRFSINRLALSVEDESVEPAANIGWQSLDVDVRSISNQPAAVFPATLRLEALDGGTIAIDGEVSALPEPSFELSLDVDALVLAGAHPYLKPLADVHLDSGALNVEMQLSSDADEPFRAAGDVEIVDFLVTETDENSRLGSWSSLRAENIVYSTSADSLEVSEVHFVEPYGDILIAEDGSINLGRVRKGENDPPAEVDDTAEDVPEDGEPAESALAVTVGRVVVEDATADFADLSLPLPFSAKIAELNGEMSTIATTSAEPSTVEMEGKVDEFGQVQINGTVTPLDPPANTDIRVMFQNVDMPKFSAYSIPFAGREIASGRLDLDLGYAISDNELTGENRIVLRDFELGDKVEHPDALSLPLGLAVALLKDPEGRIDLDVPVRGNVDDPEFRIGGVVAKALVNVLTRIVTSPFALLANLVGGDAAELENLLFEAGRAELSPPEIEKVGKIAEALGLRPQLVMVVAGAYDAETDGAVLRVDKVDQRIEERIDASGGDGDEEMYADQRRAAIEELFTESLSESDPVAALAEVRDANTTTTDDGTMQFDSLAYTEALRGRLIDRQTISDDELRSLATARAQNVRDAILATNPELAPRIVVEQPAAAENDGDGNVLMPVQLSASEDAPASPPEAEAVDTNTTFNCTDGPTVSVRFMRDGEIELDDGDRIRTLGVTRSASGARYSDGDIEFWEKGDEAMLTIGDTRHACRKLIASNETP